MKPEIAHRTINTFLLMGLLIIQGANRGPQSGITDDILVLAVYGCILVGWFYLIRKEDNVKRLRTYLGESE